MKLNNLLLSTALAFAAIIANANEYTISPTCPNGVAAECTATGGLQCVGQVGGVIGIIPSCPAGMNATCQPLEQTEKGYAAVCQ
jgi:hypothetical protein